MLGELTKEEGSTAILLFPSTDFEIEALSR